MTHSYIEDFEGFKLYKCEDTGEICVSACQYGGEPYIGMVTKDVKVVEDCIHDVHFGGKNND